MRTIPPSRRITSTGNAMVQGRVGGPGGNSGLHGVGLSGLNPLGASQAPRRVSLSQLPALLANDSRGLKESLKKLSDCLKPQTPSSAAIAAVAEELFPILAHLAFEQMASLGGEGAKENRSPQSNGQQRGFDGQSFNSQDDDTQAAITLLKRIHELTENITHVEGFEYRTVDLERQSGGNIKPSSRMDFNSPQNPYRHFATWWGGQLGATTTHWGKLTPPSPVKVKSLAQFEPYTSPANSSVADFMKSQEVATAAQATAAQDMFNTLLGDYEKESATSDQRVALVKEMVGLLDKLPVASQKLSTERLKTTVLEVQNGLATPILNHSEFGVEGNLDLRAGERVTELQTTRQWLPFQHGDRLTQLLTNLTDRHHLIQYHNALVDVVNGDDNLKVKAEAVRDCKLPPITGVDRGNIPIIRTNALTKLANQATELANQDSEKYSQPGVDLSSPDAQGRLTHLKELLREVTAAHGVVDVEFPVETNPFTTIKSELTTSVEAFEKDIAKAVLSQALMHFIEPKTDGTHTALEPNNKYSDQLTPLLNTLYNGTATATSLTDHKGGLIGDGTLFGNDPDLARLFDDAIKASVERRRETSATQIQAWVRQIIAKSQYTNTQEKVKNIQRVTRGFLVRLDKQRLLREAQENINLAAAGRSLDIQREIQALIGDVQRVTNDGKNLAPRGTVTGWRDRLDAIGKALESSQHLPEEFAPLKTLISRQVTAWEQRDAINGVLTDSTKTPTARCLALHTVLKCNRDVHSVYRGVVSAQGELFLGKLVSAEGAIITDPFAQKLGTVLAQARGNAYGAQYQAAQTSADRTGIINSVVDSLSVATFDVDNPQQLRETFSGKVAEHITTHVEGLRKQYLSSIKSTVRQLALDEAFVLHAAHAQSTLRSGAVANAYSAVTELTTEVRHANTILTEMASYPDSASPEDRLAAIKKVVAIQSQSQDPLVVAAQTTFFKKVTAFWTDHATGARDLQELVNRSAELTETAKSVDSLTDLAARLTQLRNTQLLTDLTTVADEFMPGSEVQQRSGTLFTVPDYAADGDGLRVLNDIAVALASHHVAVESLITQNPAQTLAPELKMHSGELTPLFETVLDKIAAHQQALSEKEQATQMIRGWTTRLTDCTAEDVATLVQDVSRELTATDANAKWTHEDVKGGLSIFGTELLEKINELAETHRATELTQPANRDHVAEVKVPLETLVGAIHTLTGDVASRLGIDVSDVGKRIGTRLAAIDAEHDTASQTVTQIMAELATIDGAVDYFRTNKTFSEFQWNGLVPGVDLSGPKLSIMRGLVDRRSQFVDELNRLDRTQGGVIQTPEQTEELITLARKVDKYDADVGQLGTDVQQATLPEKGAMSLENYATALDTYNAKLTELEETYSAHTDLLGNFGSVETGQLLTRTHTALTRKRVELTETLARLGQSQRYEEALRAYISTGNVWPTPPLSPIQSETVSDLEAVATQAKEGYQLVAEFKEIAKDEQSKNNFPSPKLSAAVNRWVDQNNTVQDLAPVRERLEEAVNAAANRVSISVDANPTMTDRQLVDQVAKAVDETHDLIGPDLGTGTQMAELKHRLVNATARIKMVSTLVKMWKPLVEFPQVNELVGVLKSQRLQLTAAQSAAEQRAADIDAIKQVFSAFLANQSLSIPPTVSESLATQLQTITSKNVIAIATEYQEVAPLAQQVTARLQAMQQLEDFITNYTRLAQTTPSSLPDLITRSKELASLKAKADIVTKLQGEIQGPNGHVYNREARQALVKLYTDQVTAVNDMIRRKQQGVERALETISTAIEQYITVNGREPRLDPNQTHEQRVQQLIQSFDAITRELGGERIQTLEQLKTAISNKLGAAMTKARQWDRENQQKALKEQLKSTFREHNAYRILGLPVRSGGGDLHLLGDLILSEDASTSTDILNYANVACEQSVPLSTEAYEKLATAVVTKLVNNEPVSSTILNKLLSLSELSANIDILKVRLILAGQAQGWPVKANPTWPSSLGKPDNFEQLAQIFTITPPPRELSSTIVDGVRDALGGLVTASFTTYDKIKSTPYTGDNGSGDWTTVKKAYNKFNPALPDIFSKPEVAKAYGFEVSDTVAKKKTSIVGLTLETTRSRFSNFKQTIEAQLDGEYQSTLDKFKTAAVSDFKGKYDAPAPLDVTSPGAVVTRECTMPTSKQGHWLGITGHNPLDRDLTTVQTRLTELELKFSAQFRKEFTDGVELSTVVRLIQDNPDSIQWKSFKDSGLALMKIVHTYRVLELTRQKLLEVQYDPSKSAALTYFQTPASAEVMFELVKHVDQSRKIDAQRTVLVNALKLMAPSGKLKGSVITTSQTREILGVFTASIGGARKVCSAGTGAGKTFLSQLVGDIVPIDSDIKAMLHVAPFPSFDETAVPRWVRVRSVDDFRNWARSHGSGLAHLYCTAKDLDGIHKEMSGAQVDEALKQQFYSMIMFFDEYDHSAYVQKTDSPLTVSTVYESVSGMAADLGVPSRQVLMSASKEAKILEEKKAQYERKKELYTKNLTTLAEQHRSYNDYIKSNQPDTWIRNRKVMRQMSQDDKVGVYAWEDTDQVGRSVTQLTDFYRGKIAEYTEKIELMNAELATGPAIPDKPLSLSQRRAIHFNRNITVESASVGTLNDILRGLDRSLLPEPGNSMLLQVPHHDTTEADDAILKSWVSSLTNDDIALTYRDHDGKLMIITQDNGKVTTQPFGDKIHSNLNKRFICLYTTDSVGGDFGQLSKPPKVASQRIYYTEVPAQNSLYQHLGRFRCGVDSGATRVAATVPVTVVMDSEISSGIDNKMKLIDEARSVGESGEASRQRAFISYKIERGRVKQALENVLSYGDIDDLFKIHWLTGNLQCFSMTDGKALSLSEVEAIKSVWDFRNILSRTLREPVRSLRDDVCRKLETQCRQLMRKGQWDDSTKKDAVSIAQQNLRDRVVILIQQEIDKCSPTQKGTLKYFLNTQFPPDTANRHDYPWLNALDDSLRDVDEKRYTITGLPPLPPTSKDPSLYKPTTYVNQIHNMFQLKVEGGESARTADIRSRLKIWQERQGTLGRTLSGESLTPSQGTPKKK